MKIEDVVVHPEMVWVRQTKEQSTVGGLAIGETKESNIGVVVKAGSAVAEFYKNEGLSFGEGTEILFDINRATPVELNGERYRSVHYLNILAFAFKEE